MPTQAPDNYTELHNVISERHNELSNRLQKIARFALDHPTAMALETIAGIAQIAGVQPSALIRFSKSFGYSGFSEMQRVFQANVAEQSASYKERILQEYNSNDEHEPISAHQLLTQYCAANIASLDHLGEGIEPKKLDAAINIIRSAESIYVVGQRRSYPIAAYLAYALSHVDCRVHLLDGAGGMLQEQAKSMTSNDALFVTSFHPYAGESVEVAKIAHENGIPYIALTDSALSPAAKNAAVCFVIHDAEVHSFRSLSASLCVAQTLATGLAFADRFGI